MHQFVEINTNLKELKDVNKEIPFINNHFWSIQHMKYNHIYWLLEHRSDFYSCQIEHQVLDLAFFQHELIEMLFL